MKKFLSLVLALAMTTTLLAGCGGGDTTADDSADNSASNGSVSSTTNDNNEVADSNNLAEVDMSTEPDGIVAGSYAVTYSAADTIATQIPSSYAGGRWLYGWLYDTLFYSPDGTWDEIEGLLVTDYSVADDGITWTMTIHDDVYFCNGNPLDAEAIVRCWDYQTENAAITNFADYGTDGEYTVWVTLTAPNSEFIQQMAVEHVSIFDVQAWEENLAAGMDSVSAYTGIGSGPYYMSDYELGASMTFTANENYWGEDRYPHIETIFCPIVSDASTQQTMLQSGDADTGIVSDWTVLENLVDNYGLTYVTEAGTFRSIWMNVSGHNEYLQDPIVREAITMMVDMEEVSIALSGDYGAYGVNCFNTGVDYTHNYVYDPEGGLALLDSIGVDPADITLLALTDSAQAPIFSNIQAQLAKCGITVTFTEQDNSAMVSAGMAGDWDLWAAHGGLCIGAYRINVFNILSYTAAQRVVADDYFSVIIADLVDETFIQETSEAQFDYLEQICAVCSENFLYLGNLALPTWHVSNDTLVNYVLDKNGTYWRAWDAWMA